MRKRTGFLCGICYPLLPRPVVNRLNVAARVKMDVALDVHAKRLAGGVLHYVIVNVTKVICTVRGKYLEGENIGEFGKFMVICQIFTLQMS